MSENYARALEEYNEIARKHSLDPDLLKKILELSVKGRSKTDIANLVGTSRQTVHRYLKTVREEIDDNELFKLIIGLVILGGGLYVLKEFIGEESGK